MSENVGLTTPRGSGTSGYVTRNLSNLRPRDAREPPAANDSFTTQRKPDAGILEHERKRKVEEKVFALRCELEDQAEDAGEEPDEEMIDSKCQELRASLQASDEKEDGNVKGYKPHQVHELAQAKIQDNEKVRRALGIRAGYEEGSHWKRQDEVRSDDRNAKRTRYDANSR